MRRYTTRLYSELRFLLASFGKRLSRRKFLGGLTAFLGGFYLRPKKAQATHPYNTGALIKKHGGGGGSTYTAWAWGYNSNGVVGDLTTTNRSSPVQVLPSSVTTWSTFAAGYTHMLGVRSDGTLWAWGQNNTGQLGLNDLTSRSSPVQVTAVATTWSKVAAGNSHSMAIDASGFLYAWGANAKGQLGSGGTANLSVPTKIGSSTWNAIACGDVHSLGIDSSKNLWAWGDNSKGELGNNSTTNANVPTSIDTSGTWTGVFSSGSAFTSYATKTGGALYGWGRNQYGGLGLGDTSNRSVPTAIGGATEWGTVVGACQDACAATKTDGYIYVFGRNDTYGLGTGNTSNRSSPVQLTAAGTTTWKMIAGGDQNVMALTSTGTLYCWGNNNSGGLGDGTATNRSTPITIAGTWQTIYKALYTPIGTK